MDEPLADARKEDKIEEEKPAAQVRSQPAAEEKRPAPVQHTAPVQQEKPKSTASSWLDQLNSEKEIRMRNYRTLGLCAGIALVILLI